MSSDLPAIFLTWALPLAALMLLNVSPDTGSPVLFLLAHMHDRFFDREIYWIRCLSTDPSWQMACLLFLVCLGGIAQSKNVYYDHSPFYKKLFLRIHSLTPSRCLILQDATSISEIVITLSPAEGLDYLLGYL